VPDVAGSNTIALDKIVVTDSSGNVGIGTSSPSHKLSVITDVDSFVMKVENDGNSAGTVGNAYADASDGLWVDTRWNTATNTPFKVTSNSGTSDMMIIKGDGKVGIGTSSPSETLHVNGTVKVTGVQNFQVNSGGGSYITVNHTGNESWSWDARSGSGSDDYLDVGISGGTRAMSWHEDGRVGIGTTSPENALHIASSDNAQMLLQNTSTGDASIKFNRSGQSFFMGIESSDNSFRISDTGTGVGDGDRLIIDTSGNPTFTGTAHTSLQVRSADLSTVAFMQTVQGTDIRMGGSTNHPVDLYSNGTRRVRITSTGDVGIGTASPNATLTVSQSANNIFAVERTGVASGSGQFGINVENNSQATVSYDDGSQLVFGTASSPSTHVGFTERMKISAEGYITKPNHPAFQALAQGASNSNSGGYLDFTHTILNQGNHFSTTNNRFTAPVAGVYHFHFHTFIDQSSNGTGQISFYKNGSYSFSGYEIRNYHQHRSTGYGPTMVLTATVGLNKFDYIQIYNAGIDLHANASNYFGGHLIG
jgi:hypothetical protein